MGAYQKRSTIGCEAESLYQWHARDGAFERLAPPWQRIQLVSPSVSIELGSTVHVRLKQGPIWRDWIAEIVENLPSRSFTDRQVEGPFAKWEHRHEFKDMENGVSELVDSVHYTAPFGRTGTSVAGGHIKSKLERVFRYRHAITRNDMDCLARYAEHPRLKILITGGYGLIGSKLRAFLRAQGHQVASLSRSPKLNDVRWRPDCGEVDLEGLEGFDAVVHLAGESLASGRWNSRRKEAIWSSRVDGTRLLVESLAKTRRPPRIFICASGVGYYGDRGDTILSESDCRGDGFLAKLCAAWEGEASKASRFAKQVAYLRTGVVLDAGGGALAKMHLPFLLGLGGPFGNGKQWMSWISMEDWIGGLYSIMMNEESGPFNLVAPEPVVNESFVRKLGCVLNRPAIARVPASLLSLGLGDFAKEGLLSSARAKPERLHLIGYRFLYPDIGDALRFTLGYPKPN